MKTNVLLFGPPGSGKNEVTKTLLKSYIDPFGKTKSGVGKRLLLLSHEPGYEAIYGTEPCKNGFDLHVKQHFPANIPLSVTEDWLRRDLSMTSKAYTETDCPPMLKREYDQFVTMYGILTNFTCEVCGTEFGMADDWTDDTVLIQDGLTGITEMVRHHLSGPKTGMSQRDFWRGQDMIAAYMRKCCGLKCSYVMLAHGSREVNAETRVSQITLDTLGVKLAPRLIVIPDEVIYTVREGQKFKWSTDLDGVQTKTRRLPYAESLPPDFNEIFKRGE